MSEFTKTIIVDLDHTEQAGQYRQTIKAAVDDLGSSGGVIIVEQGIYDIDGTGYKTTVRDCHNITVSS